MGGFVKGGFTCYCFRGGVVDEVYLSVLEGVLYRRCT